MRWLLAAAVAASLTAPAAAEPLRCHPARGKLQVELKPGYTAADVAAWWMASRCARVVLPSGLARRSSAAGVHLTERGERLRRVLDRLLARLDMVAVGADELVVFVDAAAARTGPGVSTPAGKPGETPVDRGQERQAWKAAVARGVRSRGAHHVALKRDLLDKVLARPRRMARAVRIVPSIKDGKPYGFKLYAIRPGSLFAALGFKNGDTLTAINGNDLSSPDKALEVYAKVRGAKRLEVAVTRRGKPVTLRIDIE